MNEQVVAQLFEHVRALEAGLALGPLEQAPLDLVEQLYLGLRHLSDQVMRVISERKYPAQGMYHRKVSER